MTTAVMSRWAHADLAALESAVRIAGQVAEERMLQDVTNATPARDVFSSTDIARHLALIKRDAISRSGDHPAVARYVRRLSKPRRRV
jgi:hypothetical protein